MNRKSATPRKTNKAPVKVYGDLGPTYEESLFARLTPARRDGLLGHFMIEALPDEDRKHVMTILRAFNKFGQQRRHRGGAR